MDTAAPALLKRDNKYWCDHGVTPADIPAFLLRVGKRRGVLYDLFAPGLSIPAAIAALNAQMEDLGVRPEESDGFSYSRFDAKDDLFPKHTQMGWIACFPVKGNSEGYYAHIHLLGRGDLGLNRMIANAKTYSADNAWLLVRTASILMDY